MCFAHGMPVCSGARDLRAQSAPGLPCALSSREGQRDGKLRRNRAVRTKLYVPSLRGAKRRSNPAEEVILSTAAPRAPVLPAHIGQAGKIRRHRPPGLAFMGGDAFFGVGDLALEFEHRPLRIAELVMAAVEARDFQRFQSVTVF